LRAVRCSSGTDTIAAVRRWALRICVFLTLGAIVNLAVAWGCGAKGMADLRRISPSFSAAAVERDDRGLVREWWTAAVWQAQGCCLVSSERSRSVYSGDAKDSASFASYRHPSAVLPQWARRLHPEGEFSDDALNDLRQFFASGWPFRGMRCEIELDATSSRQIRGGYAFSGSKYSWRLTPFVPIWPGFAINTAFYAVVLWLLFAGPFVLRRWRRIRRGLCPKCAYDLRGSAGTAACPECGELQ